VDIDTIRRARAKDLEVLSELELLRVHIFYKSCMQKVAKKMQLRQQIIATALAYYSRYFLKNGLCDKMSPDPLLVGISCLYLAAKIEEFPMLIQNFVSEAQHTLKCRFFAFF
jgi:cyclin C